MLPCRLNAMLPVSAVAVAAAPPGTTTSSDGVSFRPLPWTGTAPAGLAAAAVAIVVTTARAASPTASRRKSGARGWFRMLGIVRQRLWNVLGADLAPAAPLGSPMGKGASHGVPHPRPTRGRRWQRSARSRKPEAAGAARRPPDPRQPRDRPRRRHRRALG